MSSTRKPLDGLAVGTMLILCLCWGLQQVAVKAAAPSVNPILQIGARSALAALMVGLLMLWRGPRLSLRDGTVWPGIVTGLLFALEFFCVAIALMYTTASHVSVFLYTAPIFLVLGLHWLVPGERMAPRQWCGVLLAFAGIALAFADGFGGPATTWQTLLLGDGMAVAGGILWAATTLTIRATALSEAAPTTTLLYQLGIAGVILVALPLAAGNAVVTPIGTLAWASLIFQTVVVGFASFLAWFWLLRRYLTSRLSVFSFLTPLFGVAFGVLLLDDPVGLGFGGGTLLVMAGIVLVNLRSR
ncbi:MAG TPA: DMT family transporter [Burkholderiaceae bacterium]|nr:DMT family transporter [Burkholderiaceae bacterium]